MKGKQVSYLLYKSLQGDTQKRLMGRSYCNKSRPQRLPWSELNGNCITCKEILWGWTKLLCFWGFNPSILENAKTFCHMHKSAWGPKNIYIYFVLITSFCFLLNLPHFFYFFVCSIKKYTCYVFVRWTVLLR